MGEQLTQALVEETWVDVLRPPFLTSSPTSLRSPFLIVAAAIVEQSPPSGALRHTVQPILTAEIESWLTQGDNAYAPGELVDLYRAAISLAETDAAKSLLVALADMPKDDHRRIFRIPSHTLSVCMARQLLDLFDPSDSSNLTELVRYLPPPGEVVPSTLQLQKLSLIAERFTVLADQPLWAEYLRSWREWRGTADVRP